MKRTVLFLTLATCLGLSMPAQAIYNPLSGISLNPLKNCSLFPKQIDNTKLGLCIIAGSLVYGFGSDVSKLICDRAKSTYKFCKEHGNWALTGCGIVAGAFVAGIGVGQNLNKVAPLVK